MPQSFSPMYCAIDVGRGIGRGLISLCASCNWAMMSVNPYSASITSNTPSSAIPPSQGGISTF